MCKGEARGKRQVFVGWGKDEGFAVQDQVPARCVCLQSVTSVVSKPKYDFNSVSLLCLLFNVKDQHSGRLHSQLPVYICPYSLGEYIWCSSEAVHVRAHALSILRNEGKSCA